MAAIGKNFVLLKSLHKNENTKIRGIQNRGLTVLLPKRR